VEQGVAMILAQIAGAPVPRPSKLRPDLPATFEPWFLRALDRDVDKRFQTAKEFATSLAQALKPGATTAFRSGSMPSDEEGAAVDALVSSPRSSPSPFDPTPGPALVSSPIAASPPSHPTPAKTFDVRPEEVLTMRPIVAPNPWRAIGFLIGAAVIALGGYALWLYVLHPAPGVPVAAADAGSAGAGGETATSGEPLEKEPYALQIASAQHWLHTGKPDNALAMFKEAFNNGGTDVARALKLQAETALDNSNAKCRLTGLGRPRPFELSSQTSRPTIALSADGLVAAWVDNHEDKRKNQAFTSLLDPAMRRISRVHLITPEADNVRHPQLVPAGDKLAFIYWDSMGKEPGVYVRMLEDDGRIAGPARRISGIKRHDFYPTLTRAADATFWAVWEEELDGSGGSDIVARQLGKELDPIGPAVRLTALAPNRRFNVSASRPDAAVAEGQLIVVFSLERNKRNQVMLLRAALGDSALATGLLPFDAQEKKKRKGKAEDRFVGQVTRISSEHGKHTQPRLACTEAGCFAVWDDEKAGALAAFVDGAKGEAIWHREFARQGARPAVASASWGAAVAWYDGNRVKLAALSRDGVEADSVVARVGGAQPYPAIVAGTQPGQWYISWRDYEGGHPESFVVRAECQ
jgi:eukaryotic-like serine/threonine-protein kinase